MDANGDGDYVDPGDVSDADPFDDSGHGTHIAGTNRRRGGQRPRLSGSRLVWLAGEGRGRGGLVTRRSLRIGVEPSPGSAPARPR